MTFNAKKRSIRKLTSEDIDKVRHHIDETYKRISQMTFSEVVKYSEGSFINRIDRFQKLMLSIGYLPSKYNYTKTEIESGLADLMRPTISVFKHKSNPNDLIILFLTEEATSTISVYPNSVLLDGIVEVK